MMGSWHWHLWMRWIGAALITGTGLMLTSNFDLQLVGAGVLLIANLAYVARWLVAVKNTRA